MDSQKSNVAIGLAVVAVLIAIVAVFWNPAPSGALGGTTAGFSDARQGYKINGTTIVSSARAATFSSAILSSAGTTTLSGLSTSATQGFCVNFNATSTNTALNLTFAASSSPSAVGVIPVVRWGACP